MKCDTAMRRSKERASRKNPHVEQWRCTQNCARCICGMKYEKYSGAWVHLHAEHDGPDQECNYEIRRQQ